MILDESLFEDFITESKADMQKFIDYFGEDLVRKFYQYQNRFPKAQRDLYFWMTFPPKRLESELSVYENTLSKTQERKKAKESAELLYNSNGWKVYKINDLAASSYYGKNTEWCINSDADSFLGDAAGYWNDYKERGYEIYFFISGYDKYALQYKDNNDYFIYDEMDNLIPYIPDAPKVNGLPNVSTKLTPWFMGALNSEYHIASENDISSLDRGDEDVVAVADRDMWQTCWELVTKSGKTCYFIIWDQTELKDITEDVIEYKNNIE